MNGYSPISQQEAKDYSCYSGDESNHASVESYSETHQFWNLVQFYDYKPYKNGRMQLVRSKVTTNAE